MRGPSLKALGCSTARIIPDGITNLDVFLSSVIAAVIAGLRRNTVQRRA